VARRWSQPYLRKTGRYSVRHSRTSRGAAHSRQSTTDERASPRTWRREDANTHPSGTGAGASMNGGTSQFPLAECAKPSRRWSLTGTTDGTLLTRTPHYAGYPHILPTGTEFAINLHHVGTRDFMVSAPSPRPRRSGENGYSAATGSLDRRRRSRWPDGQVTAPHLGAVAVESAGSSRLERPAARTESASVAHSSGGTRFQSVQVGGVDVRAWLDVTFERERSLHAWRPDLRPRRDRRGMTGAGVALDAASRA